MSSAPSPAAPPSVTLHTLRQTRAAGHRLTMLTCYDYAFATLLSEAGVDILLVGDSLGMVLQGQTSTLPVSLDDMAYHTRAVAAARPRSLVLADMPYASYQESPEQAFRNAARLMQAGAQMVKLEGGAWLVETVEFLSLRGIPVCAHLGLTPQSVHMIGGYRVQGRDESAADQLIVDAQRLEAAGAEMVLVELIPSALGRRLTESLRVPTIGIGAGPDLTGQVLVLHDILNVTPGRKARFVKNYLVGRGSIQEAIQAFVQEVKSGAYPGPEHQYE